MQFAEQFDLSYYMTMYTGRDAILSTVLQFPLEVGLVLS